MNEAAGPIATAPEEESHPLLFRLLHTAHVLAERLEAGLRDVGLSRAKLEVLRQLVHAGEPMPLRALAEGQRCVPSNMTTLIDRLEAEGLVRRLPDPNDRRSVLAELSDQGRDRAEQGTRISRQVQDQFEASLPEAQRRALLQVLSTLEAG